MKGGLVGWSCFGVGVLVVLGLVLIVGVLVVLVGLVLIVGLLHLTIHPSLVCAG